MAPFSGTESDVSAAEAVVLVISLVIKRLVLLQQLRPERWLSNQAAG